MGLHGHGTRKYRERSKKGRGKGKTISASKRMPDTKAARGLLPPGETTIRKNHGGGKIGGNGTHSAYMTASGLSHKK